MSHLQLSKMIPASRKEVFDYLIDLRHLASWVEGAISIEWLQSPAPMKPGAEYELVLTAFALSRKSRFRIEDCRPGEMISYRQVVGGLQQWSHSQKLVDHASEQCLLIDVVDYAVPGGFLGCIVDDLWLRSFVRSAIEKRQQRIQEHFERIHLKRDREKSKAALNERP